MPKKQAVYGKRSQTTSTSTNIFASPDNTRRKAVETIQVLTDHEIKDRKLQAAQLHSTESPSRPRKALSEINGNAVLHVEVPIEKDAKKVKKKKSTKKRSKDEGSEKDAKLEASVVVKDVAQDVDVQVKRNSAIAADVQEVVVPIEEQIEAEKNVAQQIQTPIIEPSTEDQPVMAPQAIETSDCYSKHCSSLLELTAYPVSSFSEWANDLSEDFSLVKIAEASFGEVYRLSLQPEATEDTDLPLSKNDESVLKVIALTQPTETLPKSKRDRERALKKAENMSKPDDVASELKLLQRLSDIPGFTNFRDLRVLKGRPPAPFAAAFTAFNESQKAAKKELSIFPDPAKKASYSKDQLWAVIEMQDAGTDLEKLVAQGISSNIWVVWDIFWQVVLALAKGEEEAEFEHRDLHLGNICVRTPEPVDEAKIDPSKSLGFTTFEATLIDYTVSRASMIPVSMVEASTPTDSQDDSVAYIDLANDPHLFYGDSAEEYQYDIYRYMRGSIYYSSPYASFPNDGTTTAEQEGNANENEDEEQEPQQPTPPSTEQMAAIERSTGRSWRQFHPQTNLCWLHYVLFMLLEQMSWPSSAKAPSKKTKPEAHARWKKARELENALLRVQEALDPGWLGEEESLGRSGEIVAWAVEEGWLRVEDVVGDDGEFEDFGEEVLEEDDLAKQLEGLALQPTKEDVEVPEKVEVKEKKSKKKTKAKKGE
jgi:serine/threonine-protein kinase haspin